MSKQTWKVGDACFIVHCGSDARCIRMQILPATVTQVFDAEGTSARALAFTNALAGAQTEEGQPFATEEAARAWLLEYAANIASACENPQLVGERPEWALEQNMPKQGDTVYTLWVEQREILQVTVGIVRIEHGRTEVAYDQSPGNPEASNVRMRQWWNTLEEVEAHLKETHPGVTFTYVSKEALAQRINTEIDQVWDKALERVKSPGFLAGFDHFTEAAQRQ